MYARDENIVCFDCQADLKNVETWEPFIRQDTMTGEHVHVRLCDACIEECNQAHMSDGLCYIEACTMHTDYTLHTDCTSAMEAHV